jgi:ribosomal protein RSM22 (predicted rRNA methylase)
MIQFPKNLENFLLAHVKRRFYRGTKREAFLDRPFGEEDLRFFAKGVAKLSDLFTVDRDAIAPDYLNQPDLRAGYLLYFLPINYAKTRFVLDQIPRMFWERPSLRVLDLGAGPGSAALALLEIVRELRPQPKIDLTLVDQNERALEDAAQILAASGVSEKNLRVERIPSDLRRFRFSGKYDLILLSHCLNEWRQAKAPEKGEWLLGKLREHLAESGVMAILEPALKRPTRELMALRDHLLAEGDFSVLAPCLHERICPMLAATHGDWCHFYVEWEEPEYLRRLDRLVKNENRFLKVSYLLLGPKKYYESRLPRPPEIFRVVSNRMATKGKTELVLCGPPGRIQLTRLDKDRSPANADLDQIRRGDLLNLAGAPAKGFEVARKRRLGKHERIKKL